jgi:hypothetical protein
MARDGSPNDGRRRGARLILSGALLAMLVVAPATAGAAPGQRGGSPWQPLPAMAAEAGGLAVVATPQGVYAIGGTQRHFRVSAAVERYDPASGVWSSLAPLPDPRTGLAAAATADGTVYAIGGYSSACTCVTPSVDAYDPATDAWTPLPSLPDGREGAAAAVGADGRIYVIGGYLASGDATPTVEVYDPVLRSWTMGPALGTARWGLGAATGQDGRIYAIGGFDGAACVCVLSSVEALAPSATSWTPVHDLASPRDGFAAMTAADGHIVVAGGTHSPLGAPARDVELYDPATDTWSAGSPLLESLGWVAGAAEGGALYVLGGEHGVGAGSAVPHAEVLPPGPASRAPVPNDRPVAGGVEPALPPGITFRGGFESGGLGAWPSIDGGHAPDSASIESTTVSEGLYALDIHVHPTDQAYAGEVADGRSRTEVTLRTYGPAANPQQWIDRSGCNSGQTSWYRAQYFLPADLNPNPNSFNTLTQWHAPTGSLPEMVAVKVDGSSVPYHLQVRTDGGLARTRYVWDLGALPTGLNVWRDVIVGVHWEPDTSGWIEVWVRSGLHGPFTRVVDGTVDAPLGGRGVPTLYPDVLPVGCYLKLGYYRGPLSQAGSAPFPRVGHVIEDGMAIGQTFGAIAALAPT